MGSCPLGAKYIVLHPMSIFLDTRGRSTLGIAVCARCGLKMSREDLFPDPNAPGLMCCKDDLDTLDPWRLAPRETEQITMEWVRPDIDLGTANPMPVYVNPLQAVMTTDGISIISTNNSAPIAVAPPVTSIGVPVPWTPTTQYPLGAQVTATNPLLPAASLTGILFVYTAMTPGVSGTAPPRFPVFPGADVLDGQVIWINEGIYLP